jgi:hypothetical protein
MSFVSVCVLLGHRACGVFHSRDFPFPNSRDPNDFLIPDFPGYRSGIPGNRIYKVNLSILPVFSIKSYEFVYNPQLFALHATS